jgi:hypothetical protein
MDEADEADEADEYRNIPRCWNTASVWLIAFTPWLTLLTVAARYSCTPGACANDSSMRRLRSPGWSRSPARNVT